MLSLLLPIATRYCISSFDKQMHLLDLIGQNEWSFDPAAGLLSFNKLYQWNCQILGTKSSVSGTWLWAWANSKTTIPTRMLTACLALKTYGEKNNVHQLTTPQFPLSELDDDPLVMLASGICEANAYYRCPYEGGALFVLIKDANFPKCSDPPLNRIATVFPQAIASLDIPNHKLALTGYLEHYGLSHEQNGDKVVVKEAGEVVLLAAFDGMKRMINLEVNLKSP